MSEAGCPWLPIGLFIQTPSFRQAGKLLNDFCCMQLNELASCSNLCYSILTAESVPRISSWTCYYLFFWRIKLDRSCWILVGTLNGPNGSEWYGFNKLAGMVWWISPFSMSCWRLSILDSDSRAWIQELSPGLTPWESLAQVTLTITVAYVSFFVGENELKLSGVLATIFAALMVGKYAQPLVCDKDWTQRHLAVYFSVLSYHKRRLDAFRRFFRIGKIQ
jgi:hypothetical protein